MNLTELWNKYKFSMHYASDAKQLHRHINDGNCEVLAYAFAGDLKQHRNRSWAIIYQGPRSMFACMCGQRISLSEALQYFEGFKWVIDVPEKNIDIIKKQVAIEKI